MTTTLTLTTIEEALRLPFPPQEVKFLPKMPRKNEKGQWVCQALPYADKRAYEDRLNELAFGYWDTPYTPPHVAGNKLIIPVTVILCGIAHTDYGEAFLSSHSRNGEMREEENTATEAYSQAFRRACAQFRLGRYLYDLPKLWLPYDPEKRRIAISEGERVAWVEKLYKGLQQQTNHAPEYGASSNNERHTHSPHAATPPLELVDQKLLAWLCKQLDPIQTKKACEYYRIHDLASLTASQALHLSDYIEAQKRQREASIPSAR